MKNVTKCTNLTRTMNSQKNSNSFLFIDTGCTISIFFTSNFPEQVLCAHSVQKARELLAMHSFKSILFNRNAFTPQLFNFIEDAFIKDNDIVLVGIGNTESASQYKPVESSLRYFTILSEPLCVKCVTLVLESAAELYDLRKDKLRLNEQLDEKKLHALESDRLKAFFLSNLSHEIRTPLNCILGFSSIIDQNTDVQKIQKFSDMISKSCDRLLSVMDDIITTSMLYSGNFLKQESLFDLVPFFRSIIELYVPLCLQKKLAIKFSGMAVDCYYVYADKPKLHEVFKHLLNNAIKFTDTGYVEIGILQLENRIFYVKDTGIGIDKDKQEEIFKTFNQGHNEHSLYNYGGNGLGLSIVKGIIDLVDGKVWVDSEKGKGATFYFQYPMKRLEKS